MTRVHPQFATIHIAGNGTCNLHFLTLNSQTNSLPHADTGWCRSHMNYSSKHSTLHLDNSPEYSTPQFHLSRESQILSFNLKVIS
jgi:hypothetical protein